MITISTKIMTSTTMVGDDDADTDNVDDNDCLLWQRSLNYNANTMMDDWWWLNVANTNLAVGTSSEPVGVGVSTLVPRAKGALTGRAWVLRLSQGRVLMVWYTGQSAEGWSWKWSWWWWAWVPILDSMRANDGTVFYVLLNTARVLTYFPLDKMDAISQTIFRCIFVNEKFCIFDKKIHLCLFLVVLFTMTQYWFR